MKIEYTTIAKVDGHTVFNEVTESDKTFKRHHKQANEAVSETIRAIYLDDRGRQKQPSVYSYMLEDFDSLTLRRR